MGGYGGFCVVCSVGPDRLKSRRVMSKKLLSSVSGTRVLRVPHAILYCCLFKLYFSITHTMF